MRLGHCRFLWLAPLEISLTATWHAHVEPGRVRCCSRPRSIANVQFPMWMRSIRAVREAETPGLGWFCGSEPSETHQDLRSPIFLRCPCFQPPDRRDGLVPPRNRAGLVEEIQETLKSACHGLSVSNWKPSACTVSRRRFETVSFQGNGQASGTQNSSPRTPGLGPGPAS